MPAIGAATGLPGPRRDETLPDVTEPQEAAARLWEELEGLARGLPAEGTRVPTVKVVVEGGATLEVFRAERIAAKVVAWRVRCFADQGVRVAAILGTHDGRATLTTAAGPADAPSGGGLIIDVTPAERDIADLSEAIATAIRALMDSGPSKA